MDVVRVYEAAQEPPAPRWEDAVREAYAAAWEEVRGGCENGICLRELLIARMRPSVAALSAAYEVSIRARTDAAYERGFAAGLAARSGRLHAVPPAV